jgi:multidrug efflux pump subunit AcrB
VSHPAAFSVRRWQFTLVVFFGLIAIGFQSLRAIPKAEDPSLPLATFLVVAVLPGASPSDVERLVVDPIESRLGELEDVKRQRSDISDGLAVIQVEFREGVDANRKHDDVLREISSLRPTLPAELTRLDVKQFDTANVNVLETALVADFARYHQLDSIASGLKKRLEAVPGVGHVELSGLPAQEVTVAIDLDRMVALGVSPYELMAAIGADAQNLPAGSVELGSRRFNVKTSGDYASVSEIEDTVVRSSAAGAIKVRDVAQVQLGDSEATSIARFGGKRAVLADIAMREGGNLLELRPRLAEELRDFGRSLPSGVNLEIGFDQSKNVSHRLAGFSRDFALAIALVLLTLLPLGMRASLVVMVSIPLSLAVGLSILYFLGFSINQLSIVGFVIALGLLVDDSIVVVENVARHIRNGAAPRDAAIVATRQITISVLGCTIALVLAFVPILALPGAAGLYIRSLPLAVIASVGASLLVSLTIVPFLASVMLKPEHGEGNRAFRWLTSAIETVYRPLLSRALRHRKTTLALSLLLVLVSLALVPRIGFGLFPKAGLSQFMIQIETDNGTSLPETDRAAKFVESTLKRFPQVRMTATVVGKGHPQVYYNVGPRSESAAVADVLAEIEPMPPERTERLIDVIRDAVAEYPGAHIELHEFQNGPPVDAPLALRLLGNDNEALREAAAKIDQTLRGVPGTRDVRNPSADRRIDLRLRVDREIAALFGVAVPDVDRAVRLAVGGVNVGSFYESGADEPRPIRVIVQRDTEASFGSARRPALGVLDHVYVPNQNQAAVPLGQLARLDLEPSPTAIRHYDRERAATVTAQIVNGHNTNAVTTAALARLNQIQLPKGVRMVVAGEVESRKESFGGMGTAVVIAAFGLLAVLVLEFRTFRGTLIVASVLPLGAVGGQVALLLTGYTLSFTASIGFIALMGIEIKNSILLVDYTNQLRKMGLGLDNAIQKAGEARFVPVLFTTLTALGGLLPLVYERSALYSPLAVVLVGGLISSTLLARIVTPVLYRLLPPPIENGLQEQSAISNPGARAALA